MNKKVVKTDSKTKKKASNLFPRACRFIARSLLAVGILLLVSIYLAMANFALTYGYITQDCGFLNFKTVIWNLSPSQIIIYSLVTIVFFFGIATMLYCSNAFFRRVNRTIANFFNIPIFIYELGISFIVWAFATTLLLSCLPCAAIYTILGLILNQLFFCLAYVFGICNSYPV